MHTCTRPAPFLLLALLLLSACGELTPAATPVPPTVPPTPSPQALPTPTYPPTATRPPTEAVPPTETASPSAPPEPTAEPTATIPPTEAPTELPAPSATPEIVLSSLADLPNLLDQEVTVEATVIWASSFSAGFKFLLDDGSAQATLLLWSNVYDDCWAAPELMVGAVVRAHGTVGEYQGEWQVEAGYGGDVKVLSPAAPPPLRQISAITPADITTRVTIEGTVSQVEAFSGGQRVYVDDGSATIMVLLWQNILDRVPDSAHLLTLGTLVRISGVVDEYEGTLELVPQLPYSVVVP